MIQSIECSMKSFDFIQKGSRDVLYRIIKCFKACKGSINTYDLLKYFCQKRRFDLCLCLYEDFDVKLELINLQCYDRITQIDESETFTEKDEEMIYTRIEENIDFMKKIIIFSDSLTKKQFIDYLNVECADYLTRPKSKMLAKKFIEELSSNL